MIAYCLSCSNLFVKISEGDISHRTNLFHLQRSLYLFYFQKFLYLILSTDRNYHFASFCKLGNQFLRDFFGCCSDMNNIEQYRFIFGPAISAVSLLDHHFSFFLELRIAFGDVLDGLLDQLRHVFNAVNYGLWWDYQGHSCREVSCSTADIQHFFSCNQFIVKILQGIGMHVWG